MKNSSRDTALWTDGSGSWMNLNRRRAPSGRKDFLEKNSRFFTGHALPEKMPAVSSDTERKRPADLSGVFRKGQAYIRSQVYEMRKTGKNGRGILRRLPQGCPSFYGGQKYFLVRRGLETVSGTI